MNYIVRHAGDVTVLDLSGRIGLGEALAFGSGGAAILHDVVRDLVKKGSKKLLFSLRHVTYVDSSGLGELMTCATTLHNQGGELRICAATAAVQELLHMMHLDSVLHLDKDEAAAVQAFARQRRASAA